MLYGVASIRDAAGADRLTFRVARVGVRGAGALLPASSAARGGADVGAPCHPSRDRVILLSILTYTFCVRLVCRTPARPAGVLVARSAPVRRGVRGHADPRDRGDRPDRGLPIGFARVAGVPAVRGRGRARFDSRRRFARCLVSRPGYARG